MKTVVLPFALPHMLGDGRRNVFRTVNPLSPVMLGATIHCLEL